ncbi:MAG: S41 family peptidase [Treponema sp.]|jgi:carboxyl-terminal processing protease|nr:S41 family peptidase [Treponema sp.]
MKKDNVFCRKNFISLLWVVSGAVLCVIFAAVSVPRLDAQGQSGENNPSAGRRYAAIIQNVFDFIQRNYVDEVDPKVIYEGAMTGMLNALGDPYSVYMPESEMTDLNDTTQGNFGGVGLYISAGDLQGDGTMNYLEVAAPMEDTPGWRAGINPGDHIISIDGEGTRGMTMEEVLSRLRGTPGEKVTVMIRRGEKLEFPVDIVRAVIEVPTTKYAVIDDIGYLKLITFTPMTMDRAREAILEFRAKGYKSLILDLRNNYGGLLESAVGISSLFLDGGLVVSTKSRIPGESRNFNARRVTMVGSDIPIVVLINKGSASASEIVAGALKDRGRAYLVGEKSYGKGLVQQVYPLEKGGFKITTARYYTPSDVNIDKIGIPPDREVSFPDFTDADVEKLGALIKSNAIRSFIEANPAASAGDIDAFAGELGGEYGLDRMLLRRLVRNEQNRTSIAPVYDLEYDVQLQEAVNILRGGTYRALMQTTKTLKVLQEEAVQEEFPLAS